MKGIAMKVEPGTAIARVLGVRDPKAFRAAALAYCRRVDLISTSAGVSNADLRKLIEAHAGNETKKEIRRLRAISDLKPKGKPSPFVDKRLLTTNGRNWR